MGFQSGLSGLNVAAKNLDIIGFDVIDCRNYRSENRQVIETQPETVCRRKAQR